MLLGTTGTAVPLPPEAASMNASVSPRLQESSSLSLALGAPSIHHNATHLWPRPPTDASKPIGAPSPARNIGAPPSDHSHDTHAPPADLAAAADGGDRAPSWPASASALASSLPALAGTKSSPSGRPVPPPVSPPDAAAGPTVVLHLATPASVPQRTSTSSSSTAPAPALSVAANAPVWRPPVDGASGVSGPAPVPARPPMQAPTSTTPLSQPSFYPYPPTATGHGGAIPALLPPPSVLRSMSDPLQYATHLALQHHHYHAAMAAGGPRLPPPPPLPPPLADAGTPRPPPPPMIPVPGLRLPGLAAALKPMPTGPTGASGAARPPPYPILPPPAAAMRRLLTPPPPLSAATLAAVAGAAAAAGGAPFRMMGPTVPARDNAGSGMPASSILPPPTGPRRDALAARASATAGLDGGSPGDTHPAAATAAVEATATATVNPEDLLPALEVHEAQLDFSTTSCKGRGNAAEKRHGFLRTLAAVHAIVREKLYRARRCTMEQYFSTHHKISRAQVYRLLDCYTIIHELDDFPEKPLKQRICRTLKKVTPSAAGRRQLWAAVLARFGTDAAAVASLTSGDILTTWRDLTAVITTNATPAVSGSGSSAPPPPTTATPAPARVRVPRTRRTLSAKPNAASTAPAAASAASAEAAPTVLVIPPPIMPTSVVPAPRVPPPPPHAVAEVAGAVTAAVPAARSGPATTPLSAAAEPQASAAMPANSPAPAPAVAQAPAHAQALPAAPTAAVSLAFPAAPGSSPAPVAVPVTGSADPGLKRKRMPPSAPPSPQAPRSPRAKRMTLEPSATPPSPPQVVEAPPAAVAIPADARDASLKPLEPMAKLAATRNERSPTALHSSPVHVSPSPAHGGNMDAVLDATMAEISAADAIHTTSPAAVVEHTQASHVSDPSAGMAGAPTDPGPSDRESTAAGITSAVMDMDLDASSIGHFATAGPAYPAGTSATANAYTVDYCANDIAMDDMYVADASATFTLYSAAAAAAAAAAAQEERGLGSPRLHRFDHAPLHGTRHASSASGAQLYLSQPPAPPAHHAHPLPPPPPPSRAHAAHFHPHPVAAPAPATAAPDRSFQLYAAKYHHHDDAIGYAPAHLVRTAAPPPPPPPLPVQQQQQAAHVHAHHHHGAHGNVPTSLPPHLLQPPAGAAACGFHAPQHHHHHSHHRHQHHQQQQQQQQQQQNVGYSQQSTQYAAGAPAAHARTASRGSRGHVSIANSAWPIVSTTQQRQQQQQQQHHLAAPPQQQQHAHQHQHQHQQQHQHHQQYAQLQQQQQLAAQHLHQYQHPQPQAYQTAQQQQPYPRAALLQQQQYHVPPLSNQRYAADSAAAAHYGKSHHLATAAAVSMPHDIVDGAAAAMPFLIQEMFHAAGMTALAAAGCDPPPPPAPTTTTWAATAPAAGVRSSQSSSSTNASLLAPTTTSSAPAPYPEYDYFIQDQPGDTAARDMHDLHDLIAAAAAAGSGGTDTSPVTASPMALLTAPAALDPTLGLDDGAFRHALAFPATMGGGKQHEARAMPTWAAAHAHAPPTANRMRRAATVAGPVAASDEHAARYYATMAAMAELVANPAPAQTQAVPAGVGMGGSRPSTVAAITALQAYMMAPEHGGGSGGLGAEAAGSVPRAPAM
ncbi:hypothetical protein GGF31_003085 [Allomyces arbusculus]|nr:hypothetical protein GGF31_003085 [Allomyces arbusculus]